MAFAREEEGWSCRQSMILAGISNDLRQYGAIKGMGCYLSFLKDQTNTTTIMLLLPGDTLEGDFQMFPEFEWYFIS